MANSEDTDMEHWNNVIVVFYIIFVCCSFQYDDPNATISSIIAEVKKYVSSVLILFLNSVEGSNMISLSLTMMNICMVLRKALTTEGKEVFNSFQATLLRCVC